MFWQILLAAALFSFVVFLFWFLLKRSSEQIHHQYKQMGARFALELTAPDPGFFGFVRPEPFLHGKYQGRELSISAPGKGLQNTRQTETVLKIALKNTDLELEIAGAGLISRMGQRGNRNRKRWYSGDPAFDAALDVRTNDGVRLAGRWAPQMQQMLQELLVKSSARLYLGNGVMALTRPGLLANDEGREYFESAVEGLALLAEFLED